jgi:protein TonB
MKTLNFSVHLLIVFCLFMFFQNINAQEKSKVYEKVNVIPEYLGGTKALINSITSEIKYPEEAKKDGIQGKVLVQFIVDKDGTITDSKVIRGIGHGCDEEALRVVKLLKPFKSGMEEGKPVNVKMVLPIMFTLAEKNGK